MEFWSAVEDWASVAGLSESDAAHTPNEDIKKLEVSLMFSKRSGVDAKKWERDTYIQ